MSFYVIKKEEQRKQCIACHGSGVKRSQMQGHKFVKPCVICGGLGVNVTYRTTEVPLSDALKQLAVYGEQSAEGMAQSVGGKAQRAEGKA